MSDVKTMLGQAKAEIQELLPKSPLSEDQARHLIQRYTAAIEGNFIAWMGAAAITARSVEGRYAAEENLWVEIKDDHAGMLRVFAKAAHAEPGIENYREITSAVEAIRAMIGEMSGLKNLALMAVLENTSAVFIPFLENLAKQLGSNDITYTQIHGEADIAHADQFTWALEHELSHHDDAERQLNEALVTTTAFLKKILAI